MLRFNLEQYGSSVHFLDLTIYKGIRFGVTNRLDMKPYFKPCNPRNYTNYATYKPEITKSSWITGETIRILRACQFQKEFSFQIDLFKKKLAQAGYSSAVIRSKIKYRFKDRALLMEKTTKLDSRWYCLPTGKGSHNMSNLIQTNFKPLLSYYDIRITAKQG